MSLLSIIIPVFQEEKLLRNTLEEWTAACQDWDIETEIIVSDGGSTDKTLVIAHELADRVIEYDTTQGRQSIAEGRNAGAHHAKGDYLLFTNADVQLPENSAALISALIAMAEDRGASTCRVQIEPSKRTLADRLVLGACDSVFYLMNLLGIGMGRGECHMIKRSLFVELGGYRADLIAGEDFELFKRVASQLRQEKKKIGFVWDMALYEDPRRYRKIGYPRTLWSWFRNTLSVTFKDRSHATEWSVLR